MAYHSIDLTFTYLVRNTDLEKSVAIAKGQFLEELQQAGMRVKPASIKKLFQDKNERIKIYAVYGETAEGD